MQNSNPQQLTIADALRLAIEQQRNGRLENAAALYQLILQNQPGQVDANHNMGTLAIQAGKYQHSLSYFKIALENRPDCAQYWLSYIQALIFSHQLETANLVINQGKQHGLQGKEISTLSKRAASNWYSMGLITVIEYRETGRFSEAIIFIEKWLRLNAADANAFALYSQLLSSAKRLPEAWDALNTALKLDAASPIVQRGHARLLLRDLRFNEALTAAKNAYRLDESNPENMAMLAATQIANSQFDSALQLLNLALHEWPLYAEAFSNRAQLKFQLKEYASALQDVRQALNIKPHLSQVRLLEITLLQIIGSNEEVIDSLEKYLLLEPTDLACIISLGERKRIAKCLDQADALLRTATELAPNSAVAWSNWGIILHQREDFKMAEFAFKRSLTIDPTRAIAAHNLGALALTAGAAKSALEYFRKAVNAAPDQGESFLNLGHSYYDLNDTASALAAYETACRLNAIDKSGPRAGLYMAILHYLSGDLEKCAERLVYSRPVTSKEGSSDPSDSIYWTYLAILLSWHQQNSEPREQQEHSGLLYVVGESHALATHNIQVRYRDKDYLCNAKWIPGIKQWHISSKMKNRTFNRFNTVINKLPPQSTVLLKIGEIDCRHNEGILAAAKKIPDKSISQIISQTIKPYIQYIVDLRKKFGHQFIIAGVPAPNISTTEISQDMQIQLKDLIAEFNESLCAYANFNKLDFLDLYAMTNDGSGMSTKKWHIDNVHLKPSASPFAFSKYLIKAQ